jgi:hypothetical protein
MRRFFTARLLALRAAATLSFLCALLAIGYAALPPELEATVASLSDRIASTPGTVNHHLSALGFDAPHQDAIAAWNELAPMRKIETAYLAAERHSPESGQDMLAKLARRLAADSPTLRGDPAVRVLMDRPEIPVEFAPLRTASTRAPVAPEIRSAILRLAEATDGSTTMTMHRLLDQMGIDAHVTYDVLREAGATKASRGAALVRAVEMLPPEQHDAVVRRLHRLVNDEFSTPPIADTEHPPRRPPPDAPAADRRSAPGGDGPDGPKSPPPGGVDPSPTRHTPGEIHLGNRPLPHRNAPPLRSTESHRNGGLGRAMRSPRFVGRIGGVAFGAVAAPAPGTSVAGLAIVYDASARDGRRARVIVDGASYTLDAPDWILLPAAAWSAQSGVEVLTGFGDLVDDSEGYDCALQFNYAPAIDGTLIGLRLMQSDIVIAPEYPDLPQRDGRYILGAGEVPPTRADLERRRLALEAMTLPDFRSYVFTDSGTAMTFTLSGGQVKLRGRPTYHLWTYADAWGTQVAYVPARDNPLSDPAAIERLNPTVYSAVTRFAQLAAFFRYAQRRHPRAWRAFAASVPGPEQATPAVRLPTCVQ